MAAISDQNYKLKKKLVRDEKSCFQTPGNAFAFFAKVVQVESVNFLQLLTIV